MQLNLFQRAIFFKAKFRCDIIGCKYSCQRVDIFGYSDLDLERTIDIDRSGSCRHCKQHRLVLHSSRESGRICLYQNYGRQFHLDLQNLITVRSMLRRTDFGGCHGILTTTCAMALT